MMLGCCAYFHVEAVLYDTCVCLCKRCIAHVGQPMLLLLGI